jgi:hypothetical protein
MKIHLAIGHACSRAAIAAAATAVAIGVLLPTGAASASSLRPTAHHQQRVSAAKFTWHPLALTNGWQSDSHATAEYAVKGGVVYLRGDIFRFGSGNDIFAKLPKADSASRSSYRTVYAYTNALTTGTLFILPDGDMQISSQYAVSAGYLLAYLSGVSYPVAGFTWHPLHLMNGWHSPPASFGTGHPAYAVKGGVVYLSGSVRQDSGTSPEFAVLPRSARPVHKMLLLADTFGDSLGGLTIKPSGALYATSRPQANARGFTSLAAISYPAAGANWHLLALKHGWSPAHNGTGSPAYTVIAGVVYLSGSMHASSGSTGHASILPLAARPAASQSFALYTADGTGSVLNVFSDGLLDVNSASLADAYKLSSLAAISYPRS